VVGRDNCVRYEGLTLQIPSSGHRRHFVKATVPCMNTPTPRSRCSTARAPPRL
jgi:hypothetical protein